MKNEMDSAGSGLLHRRLKFLVVLCFLALAGMALSMKMQREDFHRKEIARHNEEISDRLMKIAQCNYLLRRLGDDQSDEVRQHLSFEIAEDILTVHPLLASVDPESRSYNEALLAMIARGEKMHPEYYIVGSRGARRCELIAWQAVDRETLKSPACSSSGNVKTGKNN